MVADDVLIQESSHKTLQKILKCASWWQGRRDASYPQKKKSYVSHDQGDDRQEIRLDGKNIEAAQAEKYLGVSLTSSGFQSKRSVAREGEGATLTKALVDTL